MSCLIHVFCIEKLEKLDEKQLALLDEAILHEIKTNPQITELLKAKMETLYQHFLSESGARRTRREPSD